MSANPWCHLDAPTLTELDLASVLVREVVGTPYLVGSCLTTPVYRDVDIRVILTDDRYRQLFRIDAPHADPLRHLIEDALTRHYVDATGLRIDFQIQQMTDANIRYPGPSGRHPLGIFPWPTKEDQ